MMMMIAPSVWSEGGGELARPSQPSDPESKALPGQPPSQCARWSTPVRITAHSPDSGEVAEPAVTYVGVGSVGEGGVHGMHPPLHRRESVSVADFVNQVTLRLRSLNIY